MIILTTIDRSYKPLVIINWVLQWITMDSSHPSYNTVYKGKLILWWYEQWNAIQYSKTSKPDTPLDLFDFTAYSAWTDLIWNWWKIVWFNIWENWLYVFKEDEIWYSNTEKDNNIITPYTFNFIFNKITSNWVLWQNVITDVEQEIFYYDWINKAVRRLWYEQNLTTLRDTAISREIGNLLTQLPNTQTSATSTFKYPNYKLFLRSELVWEYINDMCFTYNVENKSWTTETNKDCYISEKWWLWSAYWCKIMEDDITDWILEVGVISTATSKEYVFGDWVDYKKYWEIEIVGKIDNWIKLTLSVVVDWDEVDEIEIEWWWTFTPTLWTRVLGNNSLWWDMQYNTLTDFKERLDLYYNWQWIVFKLKKEWFGRVEISGVNIRWKPDYSFTPYN